MEWLFYGFILLVIYQLYETDRLAKEAAELRQSIADKKEKSNKLEEELIHEIVHNGTDKQRKMFGNNIVKQLKQKAQK